MSLTLANGVAGATDASTPFQCAPGFYQVFANQLKVLNPVTGVYASIGSAASSNYNAIGYNVLDNYIYAVRPTGTASPKLLKIDSGGHVTDLGTPTGVTIPGSNTFTSGDMDNSGHLIAAMTAGTLLSIKVSDNTASLITLTKSGSPTNVYASDFSWINGNLYGLTSTTLYKIDATTGDVTTETVTGLTGEGQNFGATWSDASDELFVGSNVTGHIFQISGKEGSSPSATKVADGTPASSNDGASCKSATSPYVSPVASDDTYSATTSTTLNINAAQGVLHNDNGYGLTAAKVSDPSNGSVTLNADGSFSYVPDNGYSGPDSFTYEDTDSSSRTTNTATVNLTVTTGTLYTATYVENGGSGINPTQGDVSESTTFAVASGSLLSKAGYTFGGWSDGTSTYAAGSSYTMGTADVVLTAQWTANATNTVTYDSQGGSSVSSGSGLEGTTISVASAPTYPGHTFTHWSTAASGVGTTFAPGGSLSLTGDITLFAQWTDNATITVTYDSQGGSSVSSGSGLQGATISLAAAPTSTPRTFAGWNTLSNGTGTNYAAGSTFTLASNVTLFAEWTRAAASTPSITNLPGSGTFNGSFTPTVSTTSDGSTSVTSSTTSICTVTSGTVNYVGVGTCTLVAHVAASTNYTSADGTNQSFTVAVAKPTAPGTPVLTDNHGSISLAWSAPTNTGGEAVTYKVEVLTNNGSWSEVATGLTSLTYTYEGTTAKNTYCFAIIAVNSAGQSPWSGSSYLYVTGLKPTAPGTPVLTDNHGSISLSWSAPTNTGDETVTYKVEVLTNNGSWSEVATGLTSLTYTFEGTTAKNTYCFAIIAVNGAGDSPWSGSSYLRAS
jgi:uncharacterized repeat protein (TIGR02543 family)